jgi:hypothetical protein
MHTHLNVFILAQRLRLDIVKSLVPEQRDERQCVTRKIEEGGRGGGAQRERGREGGREREE